MKTETWIIVHKVTGEQWKADSGKTSWRASHHAKNAWRFSHSYQGTPSFNDQDTYELREVSASKIDKLEATIQKMEDMVKSERWAKLKEFVGE